MFDNSMAETTQQNIQLHQSWLDHLQAEFSQDYMLKLKAFLKLERQEAEVYPPGPLIFNALNTTSLDQVKVVIIGQDPYHGPGQAHGLSFSVPKGVKRPPSLRNIFKEIESSLGLAMPEDHGDLSEWAERGVLLLNTALTVRARAPQSHAGQGWERFTDKVIEIVNRECQNVVFMLWGRHAQNKTGLIDQGRHLVLCSAHPSPFSAHKGFLGNQHFAKANDHLKGCGLAEIDWSLSS